MSTKIMQGTPPPVGARVTLENWDKPPFNRWAFQRVREILPTTRVHRGRGPRSMLREAPRPLDLVCFEQSDGRELNVAQWLDENFADAFIVLQHGKIRFERYLNGMAPATVHLSQSVAKSIVCATAGALTGTGRIDVDAPIEHYIPEAAASGYAGATLRQAMDMQTGVSFVEDYLDPGCDIGAMDRVSGWKPHRDGDPATLLDLALGLERVRPHGERWEYRSIETDIVAMCLERATGRRLADLVSELIWNPLGVDEDADFTIDPAGYALGCGGFNATLRDYARFGEMLTRGGTFNGNQIVPAEFVAETRTGDGDKFIGPQKSVLPRGAYRNGFWIEDTSTGVIMARGIFGQQIYSDHNRALTTVLLSTWPEPTSDIRGSNVLKLIHAIAEALD